MKISNEKAKKERTIVALNSKMASIEAGNINLIIGDKYHPRSIIVYDSLSATAKKKIAAAVIADFKAKIKTLEDELIEQ